MDKYLQRVIDFTCRIIKLGVKLTRAYEGRHVYNQLFRAATSAGANYAESVSGQSTRDFINKREVSLKELRESLFWLTLIDHARLLGTENTEIRSLLKENGELISMFAAAIATAKGVRKPKDSEEPNDQGDQSHEEYMDDLNS